MTEKKVINGLCIETDRPNVRFKKSGRNFVSYVGNVLYFEFKDGVLASDYEQLAKFDDQEEATSFHAIEPDYRLKENIEAIKMSEGATIKINGLYVKNRSSFDLLFRQILSDEISGSYKIKYDEFQVSLVIASDLKDRIGIYKDVLKSIPYIEISGEPTRVTNIIGVNIPKKKIYEGVGFRYKNKVEHIREVNSRYDESIRTKGFYEQYLLNDIDIQDSFIEQITEKFKEFGIDLIRGGVQDQNVHRSNYCTYQYNELGHQLNNIQDDDYTYNYASQHGAKVNFELSCADMIIWNDFKNKYQDQRLLTNWTTFQTKDKLGREWKSRIVWMPISYDFQHNFNTDAAGNIANVSSFDCEIYYWIVKDVQFKKIHEFVINTLTYGVEADFSKELNLESSTVEYNEENKEEIKKELKEQALRNNLVEFNRQEESVETMEEKAEKFDSVDDPIVLKHKVIEKRISKETEEYYKESEVHKNSTMTLEDIFK